MVCIKGRLYKKFFALITALSVLLVSVPTVSAETQTDALASWDFWSLQSYSNDHSESTARGNWYITEQLSAFDGAGLEAAPFGDEELRALRLSLTAEDEAAARSLMLLNLCKSELLGEACGMRFHVSNPSSDAVYIGVTYCDTNAIYSCHKNGTYYLGIGNRLYKSAPETLWNGFCSDGPDDVGIIEIPAGFAGYVYVPFSSTTRAGEKEYFSRVRLHVGANAQSTSTLYLEGIDYYSNSVSFSGAAERDYGFDAYTSAPTTNADSQYTFARLSSENRDGTLGQSLKTTFVPNGSSSGYVQLRINSLWGSVYDSSAYGLRFWVKNPQNSDIEVRLQFGDGYKPCRIGAAYYLKAGGETRRYVTYTASNESIGCITLPAQFEGYVYLPYSLSATSETAGHLILSPKVSEQITLYFDSFSAFGREELKNIAWYELNEQISVGAEHESDISYSTKMLETALGQWISLNNANDFDIPLLIGNDVEYCYLEHSGGTTEYIALGGDTVNIPPSFDGHLCLPFADSQSALYTLTAQSTEQSGSLTVGEVGAYTGEIYPDGDINLDGRFNILDLVRFKKYFAADDIEISKYSDVNADERTNTADMALVKKGLLLGLCEALSADTSDLIIESKDISVYSPLYTEGALIIAEENVCSYGADPTGEADSTAAFKKALLAAEQKGGGSVYIPEGRYLLTDTVTVPEQVTLCGQWQSPEDAPAGKNGSVILAAGDNFLNSSVFELKKSSGITGLTVIYPEQDINDIHEYDFAVRVCGSRCYTLENFTLLGAWNGIELGSVSQSCQLYYLKNVYISALNTGISNDRTSDIGRLENVNCSPEYWCQNAASPVDPEDSADIVSYSRENSRGMEFYLNDWSYALDITLKDLDIGLYFGISESGTGSNGKFYGVDITDCDTGIYIDETKIGGVDFTNVNITANLPCTAAIDTGTSYAGTCMFYGCEISGDFAYPVRNSGASQVSVSGTLQFMSGSVGGYGEESYAVTVNGGSVTLEDIYFDSSARHVRVSDKIQSLSLIGCSFKGEFDGDIPADSLENCNIDHTPVSIDPPGELILSDDTYAPERGTVVCVTDYGADTSLSDNTAAFTRALEALRGTGGTVYVPAGNWRFEGELIIPEGVELRGSNAVQFMQDSEHRGGTVLWCFSGKNDTAGAPFITLQKNSGIRGFAVYYEEQNDGGITSEYPYTVDITGESCHVINVTLTNSYNGIHLVSEAADGYYISGVNGAPVGCGIYIGGGAENGILKDCHFNPNFSYILTTNAASLTERLSSATAFRIGDVTGGGIYGLFAYGYKNGIHFVSNGALGADTVLVNCGIDGSETSVRMGQARAVDIVGGQFVAMQSENDKHCWLAEVNFSGTAKIYNSNLWGPTDYIVKLCGGNTEFYLDNLCTGYGDYSLYMTGGSALFRSVCFHNRNISVMGSGTAAEFFGCFTRGYKTIIAPESSDGATVTLKNSFWA